MPMQICVTRRPSPPRPAARRGYCAKENQPYMEKLTLEEVKAYLMESNEDFRAMAVKHAEYKRLIEEIESKPHLTAQDEMEEHRLKKLKLRLKDQMQQMVNSYRTQSEVA